MSITVSPSQTKTYEVTVTSNGCSSKDTVQVTVSVVKPIPPADANAGEDLTICRGESITLNGTGGEGYAWSTGETDSSIVVSPDRTTTYTLQATRGGVTSTDEVVVTVINCDLSNGVDGNGGASQDSADTVTDSNNGSSIKELLFLSIYPNPTKGILNLKSNTTLKNYNLVLMDMQGGIIYKENLKKEKTGTLKQLDLSGFAKGMYLLQLYDQHESLVEKVMVM